MAELLMYLKQPNYIYLFPYIWLATLSLAYVQDISTTGERAKRNAGAIEVAALGRPLFPGTLYDSRKDSFIPGVTLWDKKSLGKDLDIHPQPHTDLKFSSSDSLSSKSSLMDVSASLKASFLGGLVTVGGSGKYLHETKSSNQQSRVTMYYSETSRFEQLTMTQLDNITYPQVFEQKTATHVVTAVLYGAQAFMVFDQTFSEDENKQEVEGKLYIMVTKIPGFSIEGEGSVNMTDSEKKIAENIACTFHGDFHLEKSPTTYMEAVETYQKLPTLLKQNPMNAVPVKVWLYPLYLLDTKAAQLEKKISPSLVSKTEDIIEELGDVERTWNDLFGHALVNVFSDIKERLLSFQESLSIYKLILQKAISRVLPGIRGGEMEEISLEDILKIHHASPFNADTLNQWLHDAKSELKILSFHTMILNDIKIVDSDGLTNILLDPDIDTVVCLTFTSLKYEDLYLSALEEFLKSDKFQGPNKNKTLFPLWLENKSVTKWFNFIFEILRMRKNLFNFRHFSQANKDEKRMRFIISAISDPSSKGSSIYLYEQGQLTDTRFQPISKPPPPTVMGVLEHIVFLKLQKSPAGETVMYRVEYKQVKAHSGGDEEWVVINTTDEDVTLTGLEFGKQYLIRYRIVSKVGVSEASDTISPILSSAQPVIVGGNGGEKFSYMSIYSATMFVLTCTDDGQKSASRSASVTAFFQSLAFVHVGRPGFNRMNFQIEDSDRIVKATLWPNQDNTRFAGLEFMIQQSNGEIIRQSVSCGDLGEPVTVDVKSGKCHGIVGRSGYEVDALGFYFI